MGLKPDHWIRKMALEANMINPYEDGQKRDGVISYGVSSYGYDIRVADEYKIFTNVFSAIVDPKDFTAAVDKGAAVYQFTVALPEPLDPAKQALAVTVYDKSYFVDIAFQGGTEALKIAGSGAAQCAIDLFEDRSNPLFGGAIFPKKAQLKCAQPK